MSFVRPIKLKMFSLAIPFCEIRRAWRRAFLLNYFENWLDVVIASRSLRIFSALQLGEPNYARVVRAFTRLSYPWCLEVLRRRDGQRWTLAVWTRWRIRCIRISVFMRVSIRRLRRRFFYHWAVIAFGPRHV